MEDNEKEIKENSVFADLHIHSRFSRACSKDLTLPNLVKWARIKGLNLLGTGDFTHPKWLSELKEQLKEDNGIFWYKDEKGEFPFILSSEISLVYTDNNKGRRIHLVYLAPCFEAVDKINQYLDTKGRRDYDGRPIFKISCRDFAEAMQNIDDRIEIIPAHCMTPWFGIFGSMSGFDSLNETFKDKSNRVHAVESGMSADPEMLWKLSFLNEKSIVSFSDSHSFWPFRLGREATIFRLKEGEKLNYDSIIKQIRENSFIGTIETDPAYGKYHFDGHSNCGFSSSPQKSKELDNICPVCKKPLIIGVENRIEKLANNPLGFIPKTAKRFYKILPLHEIISLDLGTSMNSKKCWQIYNELIKEFGNEFNILLNASREELFKFLKNQRLTDLILKNREGKIKVKPGYDGVYGQALLDKEDWGKEKSGEAQKKLF